MSHSHTLIFSLMTISLMSCQTAPQTTAETPPEVVSAEAGELAEVEEVESTDDSESSELELLDCRAQGCDPGQSCVHRSEIDCTSTEQCRERGDCSVISRGQANSSTVHDFGDKKDPFNVGEYLCTNWQESVCGAVKNEDCLNSMACKKSGFCEVGSYKQHYNKCGSEEDVCFEAHANVCLVTPEGCMASSECAQKGNCGVQKMHWGSTCRPQAESHCQESERCRISGECGLIVESGSWCAPTLNAHCEQSEACKERGLCVKSGMYCAKAPPRGL